VKTFPLKRGDGKVFAFEINASGLWTGSLARLLRRIPGVSNVRRAFDGDSRLAFNVHGEPFIIIEPFGDNSRYWVGPKDTSLTTGNAGYLEERLSSAPIWTDGIAGILGRVFGAN
jgi:hypothetical protein